MPKISSDYCPDVFHNIYLEPINSDGLNTGPCCLSQHNKIMIQEFDYVKDPFLEGIRQTMREGQRPDACNRCWHIEDNGGRSRRHSRLEEHMLEDHGTELRSIDVNVTWACNLACVMCGPAWSSTWAREMGMTSEDLGLLGRRMDRSNLFVDALDLTHVDAVHFNGGEPLINRDHHRVLSRLDERGSLSRSALSYNTNGTCYPDSDTLEFWQRARLVKIYFSIDAIGPQFEYIRYPARWSQVQDNIMRMLESVPGNVMFGINATVGCYNVFEIVDVWNWFQQNMRINREGDQSDFVWQISNGFSPSLLNDAAKSAAQKHLNPYPSLAPLRQMLAQGSCDNDWMKILDKIDHRRSTNWRQTLAVATYY